MKISVTQADIKAATPNGSFNPVSIALGRITGRKWFICKDNTAMEMEAPFRDIALPTGFVDVKVCAVDTIWSGLKLVIRKELR